MTCDKRCTGLAASPTQPASPLPILDKALDIWNVTLQNHGHGAPPDLRLGLTTRAESEKVVFPEHTATNPWMPTEGLLCPVEPSDPVNETPS